ncbi:hypothetical protein [Mangrovibacter phragmitis]|uniref:hypothetical protein n=1 Tax=Mangrovibacter phragmitis TaxID=1691903 RepID=UPI0035112E3D
MWQGIPFRIIGNHFFESTNIAISKIPHIIIDTSPDMLGPTLSVLGALIGGAIPAYVAIRAIKANKEQMLHQQLIINKQNFINELRLKISTFVTDASNFDVLVKRDMLSQGLLLNGIPKAQQESITDVLYRLDMAFNYIELMIGQKPQFNRIQNLLKAIEDDTRALLSGKRSDDITNHAELLKQVTIECIDAEWESVTSLFGKK